MTGDAKSLDDVRRQIDAIDTQLHDLIMRRTKIVEEVRRIKATDAVKIRPAREAEIAYRLLARHQSAFPRRELLRIWRELIVATLSFEGPFTVAVLADERRPGLWDLARDQYGSHVPLTQHPSRRSLIDAVRRQEATVGILPWPEDRDGGEPWWRYLLSTAVDAPRVIARLPFSGLPNGRGDDLDALVICPVPQEPTGRDRSFVAIESADELGFKAIDDACGQAGITTTFHQTWHDPNRPVSWVTLVEGLGFIDPAGRQYERLLDALGRRAARVLHLGGYAEPLSDAELDGTDTVR